MSLEAASLLSYGMYFKLRSIAGNQPWISIPDEPGFIKGVDQAHASCIRVERNGATDQDYLNNILSVKSGDQILLRGSGGQDLWMFMKHEAGAGVEALEAGMNAAKKNILVIRKVRVPKVDTVDTVEIESDGVEIRAGDYIVLRDTQGNTNAPENNQRFRLDTQGGKMLGVAEDERATPFRIEELLVFQTEAQAAQDEWVELGSMAGPPCSRVEWTNDGWLGLPSPTVRWGTQRFVAYGGYNKLAFQQASDDIRSCILSAAAGGALSSILTSPAAFWPTFAASFTTCVSNKNLPDTLKKVPTLKVETQCTW